MNELMIEQLKTLTMKDKAFNREEKEQLYKLWESSGLSKRAFCKEYGVALPGFYKWSRLFNFNQATQGETPAFTPIKILSNAPQVLEERIELDFLLTTAMRVKLTIKPRLLSSVLKELYDAASTLR